LEEGADRTPVPLGQEHCTALPCAGRAPAAMPVGPETALVRRSSALVGTNMSRAREAGDQGELFPCEDIWAVGPGPV